MAKEPSDYERVCAARKQWDEGKLKIEDVVGLTDAAKHIIVMEFYDAPPELRALSGNGGDEDWIAIVPPAKKDAYIPWLEDYCREFGPCDTNHYPLGDWNVYIGCHA